MNLMNKKDLREKQGVVEDLEKAEVQLELDVERHLMMGRIQVEGRRMPS